VDVSVASAERCPDAATVRPVSPGWRELLGAGQMERDCDTYSSRIVMA
jgi:hypothetical protein